VPDSISITAKNINDVLSKYNMTEYDEMYLLKVTKAKLNTDKYFVDE
jgi:hypothetical protein